MSPSNHPTPVDLQIKYPLTLHAQAIWYVINIFFAVVLTLIISQIPTTAQTRNVPIVLIILCWALFGYIILTYASATIRLDESGFTYRLMFKKRTLKYSEIKSLTVELKRFTSYSKYGPIIRSIWCYVVTDSSGKELVINSKPFGRQALMAVAKTIVDRAAIANVDDKIKAVLDGSFSWSSL